MSVHVCSIRLPLQWAVAACAAAAILCPAFGTAEEKETLETVLAVWRKREAATKSVKVVLAEEDMSEAGAGLEGEPIAGGIAKMQRTLIVDGPNLRHERVGELWVVGMDAPDLCTTIAAIDGQRTKELIKIDRGATQIKSKGWIGNSERHRDIHNITLFPVLWHWRPLSPKLGVIQLDSLKLVSTDERLAGVRCLLLQDVHGMWGTMRKYWVAPEQDMAVIRMIAARGDVLIHQVDATYKHDPKLGWVPEQWKATRYKRTGQVSSCDTDTVTEIKVNLDVPPATFDIAFPPGTEVWDSIAKVKTIVPQEK